jgi:hypothetical protein
MQHLHGRHHRNQDPATDHDGEAGYRTSYAGRHRVPAPQSPMPDALRQRRLRRYPNGCTTCAAPPGEPCTEHEPATA